MAQTDFILLHNNAKCEKRPRYFDKSLHRVDFSSGLGKTKEDQSDPPYLFNSILDNFSNLQNIQSPKL
jgi:hypothetical protein